jgi:hypothetical protein
MDKILLKDKEQFLSFKNDHNCGVFVPEKYPCIMSFIAYEASDGCVYANIGFVYFDDFEIDTKQILNKILNTKHEISADKIILHYNGTGNNALDELYKRIENTNNCKPEFSLTESEEKFLFGFYNNETQAEWFNREPNELKIASQLQEKNLLNIYEVPYETQQFFCKLTELGTNYLSNNYKK